MPVIGLVDPEDMKPGDLVGVNKDSYLILEKLPAEYDSRVKAMEVDARPTEDYNDIGRSLGSNSERIRDPFYICNSPKEPRYKAVTKIIYVRYQ